jgi:hypothetical protein
VARNQGGLRPSTPSHWLPPALNSQPVSQQAAGSSGSWQQEEQPLTPALTDHGQRWRQRSQAVAGAAATAGRWEHSSHFEQRNARHRRVGSRKEPAADQPPGEGSGLGARDPGRDAPFGHRHVSPYHMRLRRVISLRSPQISIVCSVLSALVHQRSRNIFFQI